MPSLDPVAEYFNKSTIHGLSYFGDPQRHWIERGFWIVTFLISMIGCFFMVHKAYSKWQQSPIIITQDDKFTLVSEIPFPTITICPKEKIVNPNVNPAKTYQILDDFFSEKTEHGKVKLTEEMLKLSEADKARLSVTDEGINMAKAMALVCDVSGEERHVKSVHSKLKDSEIEDLFKTNRPVWKEMARSQIFKRALIFKDPPWVLTEEGICYTFNSLGNFQIFKKDS